MSQKKSVKKKQQRSSGRPNLITVFIIVLAVLIIGGGIFIFLTQFGPKDDPKMRIVKLEQQYSSDVQLVVGRVQATLHDKVGTTRVFNRQHRLMFMFRNTAGISASDALPDEFQEEFKKALLPNGTSTRLTAEAYEAAVTGKENTLQQLLEGSLGAKAASLYCAENNAVMTDDASFIIGKALEEQFTEVDLLAYCAAVSEFAGIKGAQSAAVTLYGKALKDCNSWQLQYLVALYKDPKISWESWRASVSIDNSIPQEAESGLMRDTTLSQQMLRQRIQEELQQLLGSRLSKEDFDVEVMIDENIQRDLQNALDSALAKSISLQSDGNTSLDGTVILFEARTGLVQGYVSGRSVNATTKEFVLHEQSQLGVYREAMNLFDVSGLTYNTLVPYTTPEGFDDYISMRTLLKTNRLDLMDVTPSLESTVTLPELERFSRSLFDNSGACAKFVNQITSTDTGKSVYMASAPADVSDEFNRQNIRELFWVPGSNMHSLYIEEYMTGKVFADWNNAYVLCGIVGSDALGYGVTEQDNDLLVAAIDKMREAVKPYYQMAENTMVRPTQYKDIFDAVDVKNQEVIKNLVDNYVADLGERTIASKDDRIAFEALYSDHLLNLARYAEVVNTEFLNAQIARVEATRASRADELLAFVA